MVALHTRNYCAWRGFNDLESRVACCVRCAPARASTGMALPASRNLRFGAVIAGAATAVFVEPRAT